MIEINGTLRRERVNLGNFPAGGVIGTAAATVDLVADIGINQVAAGQVLSLPAPTDGRPGLSVSVANTGSASFDLHGVIIQATQFATYEWHAGWRAPAAAAPIAADFWRTDPGAAMPDGTTDVADAIVRTGQTKIDTGVFGDSGLTLDDLRSRVMGTAGDTGVTDTNMTAVGVDTVGKIRLANAVSVPDLRTTNPLPQDYGAGVSYVFKTATAIGMTGIASLPTFVLLETERRYASAVDLSGGPIIQRVFLEDGRAFYRVSAAAAAWGPWRLESRPASDFDLQTLLQLNGMAAVSLTGQVNWTNRFITMTSGLRTQEPNGYHDISMPAVGALVPVSDGTTRTVTAATPGQSAMSGGLQLNAWETLWYRAPRNSSNTTNPAEFRITFYAQAVTAAGGLFGAAASPHDAGEWIQLVSRDDQHKFRWGTGDVLGLGGQFGGGHDLTIAHWTAMKARAQGEGYFFATFTGVTPTRVGFTGTIRWIDAGAPAYINSQGFVDTTQVGRAGGTVIYGVNGAANRTWETVTAADAVAKFGGALTGAMAISAASTVVQLADNEALYYAPRLDTTGVNTGTWYVTGYSGTVSVPTHWLPVFSYQSTGANNTTQILVGGVQRSLRAGEAVFMGTHAGDTDRLHRRMGVTFDGIAYCRFTHTGFFAGAATNGLLGGGDGVMVSWQDNALMYGLGDGYGTWGNQYTWVNVPPVGAAIPVATLNGAVAVTRVVEVVSGRRYVPLGAWEKLWFIPAASIGGTTSSTGDFVITYYGASHMVPLGAVLIAAMHSAPSGVGAQKTRVKFADGTYLQPGVAVASATPALRVENDQAQGSGDFRPVTIAGQTGPGMTAPMPAVTGVLGPYGAPYNAEYRYLASQADPRGQIEVTGLILLGTDIVAVSPTIAFMAGVSVRGNPITMAALQRSTLGDAKVIPVQLRWQNATINGQTGVAVVLFATSGGGATNPYATLGVNGGASLAGNAQWLAIGPTILPHA